MLAARCAPGTWRKRTAGLAITALFLVCFVAQAQQNETDERKAKRELENKPSVFEEVTVTASGIEQPRGKITNTVQVFDRDDLEHTSARTVTEFLAENGVAYFNQWTPAQTQISLRGGATDGQGRDFRSQVVVLINGRRAGTANISKLSLQEIESIEVLRGPASLLYGSQAIGGVVNLITKNGLTSAGEFFRLAGGSFGFIETTAQHGGIFGRFDYFLGFHGARRGDYRSGRGSPLPMTNTGYEQLGGLLSVGFAPTATQRVELVLRSDGLYDAGFRGSSWDYDNYDNRDNRSLEISWTRRNPASPFGLSARYYHFRDTDDLRWGSEVIRNNAGNPAPGFDHDDNFRRNSAHGLKLIAELRPRRNNEILAGFDLEKSRLDNRRVRVPMPGGPRTQAPPFDNNSTSRLFALFIEDAQELFDSRLRLSAGVRYDVGRQSIKETPNQPLLRPRTERYSAVTWRGGASYRVRSWLSLRAAVGTAFRAPTPTELAADFTAPLGGQIIGNPDLRPERAIGYESGFLFARARLWADVVFFRNDIRDRITTVALDANRSRYVNRGESDVTGVELQSRYELGTLRDRYALRLATNGSYHFTMRDKDAATRNLNTTFIERMYRYQAALRLVIEDERHWSAQLRGTLYGPTYHDTEENLLIPQGEPFRAFIHGKNPFWLFNADLRYRATERVSLWLSVNNLLDVNQHPIFVALNRRPTIADVRFSNGGIGNSLPGRHVVFGLDFRHRR